MKNTSDATEGKGQTTANSRYLAAGSIGPRRAGEWTLLAHLYFKVRRRQ